MFVSTMAKEIKLFEAFAGIGSQYKALKNIAKLKKWTIKSVGIIEWFIPAIIGYELIHYETTNRLIESDIYIYIRDYPMIPKNQLAPLA